jgi:hypothetical protein
VGFKEYIYLKEFGDAVTQPSPIELTVRRTGQGSNYTHIFNINREEYRVSFDRISGITDNGYDVTLSGPNSLDLTGLGKGTEVYKHVIMALKKLIELENPDFLTFYGVTDEQSWMYNKFYERYLKQHYTMVDDKTYLRNDLLAQYKKRGGTEWEKIKDMKMGFDYNTYKSGLQADKEKQRKTFLSKRHMVGKIVKLTHWPTIAYITKMLQGTYEYLSSDGIRMNSGIINADAFDRFSAMDLVRGNIQNGINDLKSALGEQGIHNAEVAK